MKAATPWSHQKAIVFILGLKMENKDVPYVVHEGIVTRLERTNKRLWILCIILIISLIGSNLAWIYYESQWQYVESTTTQEVDQSGSGDNQVIGGDYNAATN